MLSDKVLQVRTDDEPLDRQSEGTVPHIKLKRVRYTGCVAREWLERVPVREGAEWSADLLVHEPIWSIKLRDQRSQLPRDADVPGLKLNLFTKCDQTGAAAADDAFAGCPHRPGVKIHRPREVKATLWWSRDVDLKGEFGHGRAALTCPFSAYKRFSRRICPVW